MNAQQLIKQYTEFYSEYTEEVPNPEAFLLGVLANRVLEQRNYIEYLTKLVKKDYSEEYATGF